VDQAVLQELLAQADREGQEELLALVAHQELPGPLAPVVLQGRVAHQELLALVAHQELLALVAHQELLGLLVPPGLQAPRALVVFLRDWFIITMDPVQLKQSR
jgi:hypothetical protein